jgi:uncharacterized protein YggU (UPF0235/DUF167 family)
VQIVQLDGAVDLAVQILDAHVDAVKAWVRAPPEDGRANAALVALLVRTLGAAKSGATLVSDETSRVKNLHVAGSSATPSCGASAARTFPNNLGTTIPKKGYGNDGPPHACRVYERARGYW